MDISQETLFPRSKFEIFPMTPMAITRNHTILKNTVQRTVQKTGKPSAGLGQEAISQCIHKIPKCYWILDNEHSNPIINTIHAHTKVNNWTTYKQDKWNIVGRRVVTKSGRTYGRADGAGHDNTLRPEWAEGKNVVIYVYMPGLAYTWKNNLCIARKTVNFI